MSTIVNMTTGQAHIPAAHGNAYRTGSAPASKKVDDLVTVVHRLRDQGLNLEQIKAALKAHAAKRTSTGSRQA